MTQVYINRRDGGGICRLCEHDLTAAKDGKVYCSNPNCTHHRRGHPTGKALNRGKKATA